MDNLAEQFKGTAPLGPLLAFHDGRLAWPIKDFCKAFNISRSSWYELRAAGAAPRTLTIGTRPMVTPESVIAWLRERDKAPEAPPAAVLGPDAKQVADFLQSRERVSIAEIFEHLGLEDAARTRALQTRIGELLHSLGWQKRRGSTGERGYFYLPHPAAVRVRPT